MLTHIRRYCVPYNSDVKKCLMVLHPTHEDSAYILLIIGRVLRLGVYAVNIHYIGHDYDRHTWLHNETHTFTISHLQRGHFSNYGKTSLVRNR